MLHVRRFGSGSPVVALHGFTLTGAQFADTVGRLNRTIVAPDLPGHGSSLNKPTSIDAAVTAICRVIESIGTPVPLLGYSQGGRLALMTALSRPHLVAQLVLVSATPGIEDPGQREARARADAETANRIRAGSVEEFVDTWTSHGITSTLHLPSHDRQGDRAVRLENTPSGLAAALVGMGQGSQAPVWDQLYELSMPVLLIHGSTDAKYAAIASRMARSIPDCTVISIAAAGHNPLLDAPDATYETVSAFLDRPR
ncbi:MAG: 2-succinyl-6-hydroxy-2,4-cyclohexadiene-1-carboxylate synthase [Acidimicrobiia bacterium]|nr:MAG: 2-succinyl-6-hydroxy-2,4-cyclohexadiene-1-carboxylate synthase [Acidimicrobiia bacterium]